VHWGATHPLVLKGPSPGHPGLAFRILLIRFNGIDQGNNLDLALLVHVAFDEEHVIVSGVSTPS
jgi:hypothetical protein